MLKTLSSRWLRASICIVILAILAFGTIGCKKKTPEERFEEAVTLLQENQVPLAIIKLKDLVNQHPDSTIVPDARFTLAGVYARLGGPDNVDKAIEQLDALIESSGWESEQAIEAHNAIIELNMRSDNYEAALAQADEGIQATEGMEDVNGPLRTLRATLLLISEDEAQKEEGVQYFETAMMDETDETSLHHQAREVLAKHARNTRDFAAAAAVYERFMKKFPDDPMNPMLKMAQAVDLKKAGEEERAEELINEGADDYMAQIEDELDLRTRTQKLNDIAALWTAYGNVEKAEELYRRIMSENTMSQTAINAQIAIGRLYVENGMFEEAIAHFEKMAEENAGNQIGQMAQNYAQGARQVRDQLAAQEAASMEEAGDILEDATEEMTEGESAAVDLLNTDEEQAVPDPAEILEEAQKENSDTE